MKEEWIIIFSWLFVSILLIGTGFYILGKYGWNWFLMTPHFIITAWVGGGLLLAIVLYIIIDAIKNPEVIV